MHVFPRLFLLFSSYFFHEDLVRDVGVLGKSTRYLSSREDQACYVLNNVGFGTFHSTLKGVEDLTYHYATGAVAKRFWDTTNAFHFLFG